MQQLAQMTFVYHNNIVNAKDLFVDADVCYFFTLRRLDGIR